MWLGLEQQWVLQVKSEIYVSRILGTKEILENM